MKVPTLSLRRSSPRSPRLWLGLLAGVAVASAGSITTAAPKSKKAARKPPTAVASASLAEAPPSVPPPGSSPLDELKRANARLRKQLGSRKPSWSPEAEAKNAEIRKIVGGFLDFEELARRALVKHWDALAVKQRSDFVSTLRELVERNYVRQFYGQPDYDLRLDKEQKKDSEASVAGTLHATSRGKKVSMALEYKMLWKTGKWVVYDVVTDDLSLLENYRAEFNKIIAKESFDALLKRMKKKLAEKPAE